MQLRMRNVSCAAGALVCLAALSISAPANAAAAEPSAEGQPPAADASPSSDSEAPSATPRTQAEATEAGATKAEAAPAGEGAKKPARPEAAVKTAPPAPPPPPPDTTQDSSFAVVRLPPSAYPEPQVRGIKGGSLWLTFHGLQWPYMPSKPGGPELVLGLSGWVWVDTGYETIRPGAADRKNIKYLLHQGRFVLRGTPTWSRNDWFVQGQIEVIGNADQSVTRSSAPDTDDLWIRVGKWNAFDVQAGRYEAWEIFHLGMGLDLNTLERRGAPTELDSPPAMDFYGVTDLFYRPSGPGNVALHLYPFRFLRFEFLGQLGHVAPNNSVGGRWTGILDFGWVKLKGGTEILRQTNRTSGNPGLRETKGGGGALQFVINPYAEFGVSAASGVVDEINSSGQVNEEASVTRTSLGGFANVRVFEDFLVGGGVTYTMFEDMHRDDTGRVGEFNHLQTYGALQYKLFQQLYIKTVFAYAKAHYAPSFTAAPPYDNTMLSGRLRLAYYF